MLTNNLSKLTPTKIAGRNPQTKQSHFVGKQDFDDTFNSSNEFRPLPKTPEDESELHIPNILDNDKKYMQENYSPSSVDPNEFAKRYSKYKGDIQKLKSDILSARRLNACEYFANQKYNAVQHPQKKHNLKDSSQFCSVGGGNLPSNFNNQNCDVSVFGQNLSAYAHGTNNSSHTNRNSIIEAQEQRFLAQLNEKMYSLANIEDNIEKDSINHSYHNDPFDKKPQKLKYAGEVNNSKSNRGEFIINPPSFTINDSSTVIFKENYDINASDHSILKEKKKDTTEKSHKIGGRELLFVKKDFKNSEKENEKVIKPRPFLEFNHQELQKIQNPEEALELLCYYKLELNKAIMQQTTSSKESNEKIRLQSKAIEQLKIELTAKDEQVYRQKVEIQNLKNQVESMHGEIQELQNKTPDREAERIIATLNKEMQEQAQKIQSLNLDKSVMSELIKELIFEKEALTEEIQSACIKQNLSHNVVNVFEDNLKNHNENYSYDEMQYLSKKLSFEQHPSKGGSAMQQNAPDTGNNF